MESKRSIAPPWSLQSGWRDEDLKRPLHYGMLSGGWGKFRGLRMHTEEATNPDSAKQGRLPGGRDLQSLILRHKGGKRAIQEKCG